MDSFIPQSQRNKKERVLLFGLFNSETPRDEAQEHIDELERLADTAGGVVIHKVLQSKPRPDPSTYMGKGKLDELKELATADELDLIVIDDELSPVQARNIQRNTNIKVIDRSGLILDIFASRAKTAAAKTQVELAQLEYILPRLTRAWTHLSRQKGGIGTKGPGETQIETDRRMIGQRISWLKDRLEKLDRQRTTQRKGREGIPRVAVIGYTNAGKSSLMNALTNAEVLAEDRLFATLDSTVRRIEIDNKPFLLSDTVGFIRKLPHKLIESFKSTLDEIREADMLLHLVDGSSAQMEDHIKVVHETITELGAEQTPTLLVFNKVDVIKQPERIAEIKQKWPEAIWISALQMIGLNHLEQALLRLSEADVEIMRLELPAHQSKAIAFIHAHATVKHIEYVEDIAYIHFSIHKREKVKLEQILKGTNNVSVV